MKREEFLHTLTGGLAATCVACLASACSKEDMAAPSPNGSGSSTPISSAFSVKLDTELKSINDFVARSGIIVIRQASGNTGASFLAVSSSCPHAGATVEFNNSNTTFFCAAHGSACAADGSVTQGPATRGLTKLTVEITGTTLTIKS